jgi:fluoride exporter
MRSLAVIVGGGLGALARYGLVIALARWSARFPTATLVVNCTGAFGLGLAGVLLTERMRPRRHLRALIGIGFFGAYTTFSTMAVEGVRLLDAGHVTTALVYWVLTLLLGQVAGMSGMFVGRIGMVRPEGSR